MSIVIVSLHFLLFRPYLNRKRVCEVACRLGEYNVTHEIYESRPQEIFVDVEVIPYAERILEAFDSPRTLFERSMNGSRGTRLIPFSRT